MINKAKTNKIWNGIKQLLRLKKSKYFTLPSIFISNEQEITNDKATADQLLNKFFSDSSIRNNLALAVPKTNLPFKMLFKQSPANSTETENNNFIIMSQSSAKVCSTFSISTSLLKTLKGILSIPLQLIFYCSFSTVLVPDQ